jgi:hypothetical protein
MKTPVLITAAAKNKTVKIVRLTAFNMHLLLIVEPPVNAPLGPIYGKV